MIKLCVDEFAQIGLEINSNKSNVIRFGRRHCIDIQPIVIDDLNIMWKKEIIYLGMKIASGLKFNVNLQNMKQKFYAASNGVFNKIGTKCSPNLIVSLIRQFCQPVLLYASEAISWSSKNMKGCNKAFNSIFSKIFTSYDPSIIRYCQFYMGVLPFDLQVELNKLNFLHKMCTSFTVSNFIKDCAWIEMLKIVNKFNIPDWLKVKSYKYSIWNYFESSLMDLINVWN